CAAICRRTATGGQRAAVADRGRECALCIEDAVSRWHYSRHFRARGYHRATRRTRAEAPRASDPLPRRARAREPGSAHQIRYHGVFAPASPDRARVVPRTRAAVAGECGEASVTDRQRALALTWAQRLKRVFAIEIETCRRCGGRL